MGDLINPTTLPVKKIRDDGGTQTRAALDTKTLGEYRDSLDAGAEFPPLVVFYDGAEYWLADGFHRLHAYRAAGFDEVACEVRQGTRRDAILHSVGANSRHGLRRTLADKRRAAETLLRDSQWVKWSDNEIGRRCVVDHKTVTNLRKALGLTGEIPSERTYTTKHGTEATMDTANISAANRRRSQPIPAAPAPKHDPDPDDEPIFALQPGARGVMNAVPRETAPSAKPEPAPIPTPAQPQAPEEEQVVVTISLVVTLAPRSGAESIADYRRRLARRALEAQGEMVERFGIDNYAEAITDCTPVV